MDDTTDEVDVMKRILEDEDDDEYEDEEAQTK